MLSVFLTGPFLTAQTPEESWTALDRYVNTPDEAYGFRLVDQEEKGGVTVSFIDLTSQTWLAEDEVNRRDWKHWLTLYRPENARRSTALLFISGGSNRRDRQPEVRQTSLELASATQSVVAELRMVPNQPLIFHSDGQDRYEDDLIAYGWDRFLRGGDPKWLARLPMTKSAVRAMDTITEFLGNRPERSLVVDKFVVAGASKRGWTTWTTAAVDDRVVAIAPIVIDLLNVVPSFKHHWEAYGFYAPAVGDYERHGIMKWQDTPEYQRLIEIVEPFEYRERLTMPKLMINATGDQFFLPDSHRFYFDELKGPKYVRYVPNADHSLEDSDAVETLAAWHFAIIHDRPLPRFDWNIDWEEGRIEVTVEDRPEKVLLWQATNPEARDFRLDTIGKAWSSRELEMDEDGRVVAGVEEPAEGWTAFMVELTYPVEGAPVPLKLTSGVAVTPDTLPFAGEMPEEQPDR